ncbi:MAG: hypothetical protein ACLFM7_14005 [Bacteroidales bacterium]
MKTQRKTEKKGVLMTGMVVAFFMLLIAGNATRADNLQDTIQAANLQDTTHEDTIQEEAPNVYLDCHFYCDEDHIRREINYVNYVRDRKYADVHVMITREPAGNEGTRFSLFMLGQNGYAELQDTLRFNVGPDESEEESRHKMVHALKTGLTSYLIKTPLWQNMSIDYRMPTAEEEITDIWNFWIFEVGVNGMMRGEESQEGYDFSGEIEANKVTEDIKLEFEFDADYERDIYQVNSETITSIHRTYDLDGLAVWSLSEHLSVGGFGGFYSSRYRNTKMSYQAAPAVEFNVFPYAESTTRQLTFLYRPEFSYDEYEDTTIFNKIREELYQQSLAIDYEVKQKWGTIDFSVDLSNYFHDFSKNRLSFRSSVNLNLVKGLNIYFMGGVSLINDQLSLPKGDATTEEILTRQQELATNYNYYTRFGISYTFGSMYNNIVNPRF